MKKQDYLDAKKSYDAKVVNYAAKVQDINADKEKEYAGIGKKNADGLIGRMRALSALGDKEPIVKWTTWLLRIFFA